MRGQAGLLGKIAQQGTRRRRIQAFVAEDLQCLERRGQETVAIDDVKAGADQHSCCTHGTRDDGREGCPSTLSQDRAKSAWAQTRANQCSIRGQERIAECSPTKQIVHWGRAAAERRGKRQEEADRQPLSRLGSARASRPLWADGYATPPTAVTLATTYKARHQHDLARRQRRDGPRNGLAVLGQRVDHTDDLGPWIGSQCGAHDNNIGDGGRLRSLIHARIYRSD